MDNPAYKRNAALYKKSWAHTFREEIFDALPVDLLEPFFSSVDGASTKNLDTIMGLVVQQELLDLSDEEVVSWHIHNPQVQYSLKINGSTDKDIYISLRSYKSYKKLIVDNNLAEQIFERVTNSAISKLRI
jgi:hypothetical protein